MNHIASLFQEKATIKGPTSRRAYLIQAIADSLHVPFQNVFNEVWHLKSDWGCDVLQMILDDTLRAGDDLQWRAKKCREMIEKSKGNEKTKPRSH